MTSYQERVSALLDSADIDGAVAAALDQVKSNPKDEDARRLFIDLLIVQGDFERADKQADILSNTAGALTLGLSLLRGRLRAAKARELWFAEGAVPAFPDGPTERDALAMQLAISMRAGIASEIERDLGALAAVSETRSMTVNDQTGVEFRDADDRIPHAVEVLCSNGSYMWVDFDRIEKLEFAPVRSVRDLAWRPANLVLAGGSETDVVICNTYFAAKQSPDERLSRATDWDEGAGGTVIGRGQKAYLAGDDAVYALDLHLLVKPEQRRV
jgi:type VI secretion system protein ImpE